MQISSSPFFTPPPRSSPLLSSPPFHIDTPTFISFIIQTVKSPKILFFFNYRTPFNCFFPPPKKYNRIGLVILFILI
jgi:hypothetical protein